MHYMKQQGKNCGWYAAANITADHRFLRYCGYFGHNFYRAVCRELGWQQEVLWNQLFQPLAMPKDAWRDILASEGCMFLSDWDSHRVGIKVIADDKIIVGDPLHEHFLHFSKEQFLESRYSNTMYLVHIYKDDLAHAMMGAEVV